MDGLVLINDPKMSKNFQGKEIKETGNHNDPGNKEYLASQNKEGILSVLPKHPSFQLATNTCLFSAEINESFPLSVKDRC